MATVKIRNGQSIEKALKIFKRKVEKEGIIKAAKAKMQYEKPSVKKKKKRKRAEKRRRKLAKRKST